MKGCVVHLEHFLLTHGWPVVAFSVQRIIAASKPNKNCWFLGLTEQCIHSILLLAQSASWFLDQISLWKCLCVNVLFTCVLGGSEGLGCCSFSCHFLPCARMYSLGEKRVNWISTLERNRQGRNF